jgi:hypothetical protein
MQLNPSHEVSFFIRCSKIDLTTRASVAVVRIPVNDLKGPLRLRWGASLPAWSFRVVANFF